jgi:hypothetical protein
MPTIIAGYAAWVWGLVIRITFRTPYLDWVKKEWPPGCGWDCDGHYRAEPGVAKAERTRALRVRQRRTSWTASQPVCELRVGHPADSRRPGFLRAGFLRGGLSISWKRKRPSPNKAEQDLQRSQRESFSKRIHPAWYTTYHVPQIEENDRPVAQSKSILSDTQFRCALMFWCNTTFTALRVNARQLLMAFIDHW